MDAQKLLIVAGDYDVALGVKRSLSDRRMEVQVAFSHRDALFAVQQDTFAAAVIDAAMFDRRTGEATIIALSNTNQLPTIIAYVTDALSDINARRAGCEVITSLDPALLRARLQRTVVEPDSPEDVTLSVMTNILADFRKDCTPIGTTTGWRDEEIQTLLALGRSLTEVLDLTEVLNRVVEAARRLTDADEGMILLPDGEGSDLFLRARVGIDLETAHNFRIKTQNTLAGEVYDQGMPVLIGASGPLKVKTEYFVNSLLYVPILLKGKSIGVLGVNNKSKHDLFDLRHQELLLNLAAYAAIAIENARIHEQTIRRNRELKALVDASLSINETLSLDVLLPTICEQLMRLLNVHHAEIDQWDAGESRLRTLARAHQAVYSAGSEPHIDPAESAPIRDALDTAKPVLVRANEHDARTMMLIPIQGGDQVYGLIRAHAPPSKHGSKTRSAETMARAGRMALELVTHLAPGQTERHYRQAEEIVRLLGAERLDLALVSGGVGSALKVVLSVGRGTWVTPPQPTMDLSAYPDLTEAIQRDVPIAQRFGATTPTPGMRAILQNCNCRSLLAIPLIHRGERQGVVVFADISENRQFTPREVELARALVAQAAMALANARLLHDLETSLSELKATQARLIQTERLSAMGELAAAVAHQVNNPLATIVLDTELLLLREETDPDMRDALNAILRAGKRAGTVVRRLLASARTDNGSAPPEPIDVVRTIDETLALVKSHIERDRMQLRARFPSDTLPPVLLPPGELDDVWLNLLLNAHDALIGRPMPAISVEVDWHPGDDLIRVDVWDNGPGIPAAIREDIFKPFFTTKKVGEGTGIGLHICRQVIERAGGTIQVESSAGVETRFIVRLPIMKRGRT
ncbi:MAG: GAF domain-containing protein [Chloroflexota bacterium]|nr:GAF domain-containing protein [Chloroflexota bacterium]